MTFNLRYYEPRENIWDPRKLAAAELIDEQNADIIAFQEVYTHSHEEVRDTTQIDWIKRAFSGYEIAGMEEKGSYLSPLPILLKTGRFILVENNTFYFTDTPDEPPSGRRSGYFPTYLCNWARVYDVEHESYFYIYNIHLPVNNSERQTLALSIIKEKIVGREFPDEPVILLGDFNLFSDSNLFSEIQSIPLTNTLTDTGPGTFHFFLGITIFPRIDHIWVSDRFLVEKTIVSRYNKDGQYPSDHYPVISALRWR